MSTEKTGASQIHSGRGADSRPGEASTFLRQPCSPEEILIDISAKQSLASSVSWFQNRERLPAEGGVRDRKPHLQKGVNEHCGS